MTLNLQGLGPNRFSIIFCVPQSQDLFTISLQKVLVAAHEQSVMACGKIYFAQLFRHIEDVVIVGHLEKPLVGTTGTLNDDERIDLTHSVNSLSGNLLFSHSLSSFHGMR